MRYFAFIDDSGTKEYAASPADYSRSGNSRYFVFGCVLASEHSAAAVAGNVAECKRKSFGTADVEIKSNWLRIPHERIRRYIEPFKISERELSEFTERIYEVMLAADLQLLAAVVDKPQMQEHYAPPKAPWYAPAVAYEFLAQRLSQAVTAPDTVSVIIDDMSGATPKGNQYKANLIAHHQALRLNGSRLRPNLTFAHFDQKLGFKDSRHSHMLQLADVASYNVLRQICDHGAEWETEGRESLPMYEWFARIAGEFRKDSGGRVQGYGIAKAPLIKRVLWSYTPEGEAGRA